MSDIFMDKGDVAVQEIDRECDECTSGPVTHAVVIDVRSLGQTVLVGEFCAACAETVASRIRDGLPG